VASSPHPQPYRQSRMCQAPRRPGVVHRCPAGASPPPRPRAPPTHRRWPPWNLREPNFRKPGSARRPRGPGSTRSPSRAWRRREIAGRMTSLVTRIVTGSRRRHRHHPDRLQGLRMQDPPSRARASNRTAASRFARTPREPKSDRLRGLGQALIPSRAHARDQIDESARTKWFALARGGAPNRTGRTPGG
jgi:hypothetical protein